MPTNQTAVEKVREIIDTNVQREGEIYFEYQSRLATAIVSALGLDKPGKQVKQVAGRTFNTVSELAATMDEKVIVAYIELIEKENITLLADKEIVDWLENNGILQHIYEEGRPEVTLPVISCRQMKFDFIDMSIRQAITTAIQSEKGK